MKPRILSETRQGPGGPPAWSRRGPLGLLVVVLLLAPACLPAQPTPGQEAVDPAGDEAVQTGLQSLFDRVESFRGIRVQVDGGVVRLTGETLTAEAREDAVALARDTDGVVYVEDEIGVATDLSERLAPAVERIREGALAAIAFLPLLVVSMLLVGLFLVLGALAARWDGGPHLRFARTPFIRSLIRQITRFVFGVAGLLVALELLDATALVGAVLGTAGILGIAVGFAFKDIVENYLAGVMLSLRQPFAPNDHVVIGSHEGKVVRLTARETILMTLAGNHLRIPNAEIYRSVMTNYTKNPLRRFDFKLSVGTGDDLLHAQRVALDALNAMNGVVEEPKPASRVAELGDSWVTLHLFGWVDQQKADFGRVRSEAIRLVKRALEDAEVSMPSPEYLVRLSGAATETEIVEKAPTEEARRPAAVEPGPPHDQQDVSVDRSLDEQIEEDRRTSDEGDLLTEDSSRSAEGADGDSEEDEPAAG